MLLVPVPRTPAAIQALILALINKDYYDSEGLIFRHVKHVTAETAEDIPWTLDGEYDPGAPVVEIGIEKRSHDALITNGKRDRFLPASPFYQFAARKRFWHARCSDF